ncbi:hypothetical protein GCM10010464_87150 [Pseudonocardia yunnanensis]|uniref:5-bromo-4-chloroindolyl phosphate hydrolysis protein n=1 Tax=Pseudonocardia yunnanensis TaxID=58107 RepID=A0ABW4F188_9PSEU
MSERRGVVRRYLSSRKNIAGMAGALAGVGLHLAGVIGDVWPVVALGLYGVGALVGPADPAAAPRLTDALRADAATLVTRIEPRLEALPAGTIPAVRRIVEVVRLVLDRLDEVADQPADRAAAPERLALAAEIVRVDLPMCLDTYLGRAPSTSEERAAAELVAQLDLIAAAADRLAAQVPDIHAERAEDLTRELRRRYGQP